MPTTATTEPKTVTVSLLKAHRHAGRDYQSGAALRLREDIADWLVAQGVAQYPPATNTAAAAASTTTQKSKE